MSDIVLSAMQTDAVRSIAAWRKSVYVGDQTSYFLGGVAGSGKTSILPNIIDSCGLDYSQVTFVAPTAKAAKVMTKKLQSAYDTKTVAATTIHSKIYIPLRERVELLRERIREIEKAMKDLSTADVTAHFDPAELSNKLDAMGVDLRQAKRDFDDAKRESDRNGPSFILNPESAIRNASLVVVDEASMVGEDITADLMSFGIPVLAIGDPFQLPPVGDKPGFTAGDPDFFLTEIHRQAADNPIIRLSADIRAGKMLRPGRMGDQVRIVRRRDDEWTLNPDYDAQVICGTHKRRWSLTGQIRDMCGYHTTGPGEFEPLIVRKNSRKIPALTNGSSVICVEGTGDLTDGDANFDMTIEDEDGIQYKVQVNQGLFEEHFLHQRDGATAGKYAAFDSKRFDELLDFGWVITAHAAQGSQWDNVIVHDESGVFRQDADRWTYTCVTRAARELTVVLP